MAKNKKRKKAKPVSKLSRKPTESEKQKGKILIFLVAFIVVAACALVLSYSI